MIDGKKVLAYIPIRSGSKGLKDKNIKDLCGKPLVAWTIEAAKRSKYVDEVIVSTDAQNYAEIAKQWGAKAPFIRPAEIATDTSTEIDVCLHLLEWLENNWDEEYDIILKLQATSPLRETQDIDKTLEKFEKEDCDTVTTLSEAKTPAVWMNTLPKDHSMKDFIKKEYIKNRQELPTFYELNGLVFAAKKEHLLKEKSWYGGKGFAVITDMERSIDIDNPIDFEIAQVLMKKRLGEKNQD